MKINKTAFAMISPLFILLLLVACHSATSNYSAVKNPNIQEQQTNQSSPAQPESLNVKNLIPASQETLILTPQDQHRPQIQAIQSATQTLDIVNYHLSDPDVVNALLNLVGDKTKHVKIRLLLDAATLKNSSKAQDIMKKLTDAGVATKASSSAFSITHQKSLVIDNNEAFVTTMNLVTTSAVTRDFGLITKDKSIIEEMNAVFEADWKNADNNGMNTPALTQDRLLWSPVNSKSKILSLISSANVSIDLDVENFGDTDVQNAIINQAKKGVKVRTLTPGCIAGTDPLRNRTYLTTMQSASSNIVNRVMPASTDASNPYMHAKMMLVDGSTFYLGSENFSFNSLTKARELGILTSDVNLANQLEDTFNHDWQIAKNPEQITKADCDSATGSYNGNNGTPPELGKPKPQEPKKP